MNNKTYFTYLALIMVVALAFTAACQPQAQPQPTQTVEDQPVPAQVEEEPTPAQVVPSPEEIAEAWANALAEGKIEEALSYLTADAVVSIVPPEADGDGVYHGHVEIRGWYESIIVAHGVGTLSECKLSGDTMTCLDSYSDDGLKALGVDYIEGEWVAVIQDGKINSYTFTITPESLAKFPAPPEAPTSTPAPLVEEPVDQLEDILGTWTFLYEGERYLLEFLEDGFFNLGWEGNRTAVERGKYVVEGNLLHYLTSPSNCPDAQEATYEAYVIHKDGVPVKLRFVLVGEDNCATRNRSSNGKTMNRFNP